MQLDVWFGSSIIEWLELAQMFALSAALVLLVKVAEALVAAVEIEFEFVCTWIMSAAVPVLKSGSKAEAVEEATGISSRLLHITQYLSLNQILTPAFLMLILYKITKSTVHPRYSNMMLNYLPIECTGSHQSPRNTAQMETIV